MDDFETELKIGFLDEAAQLLADTEQCFLNLETSQGDPAVVEKIFRLAHNLKGSARAVGFAEIAEFTHRLESLLLKIKNHEIAIESTVVSLLLKCNDHVNVMITGLKQNPAATFDSRELMEEMSLHLTGQAQPTSPAAQTTPAAEPAIETPPAAESASAVEIPPATPELKAIPAADNPAFNADELLDDAGETVPPADAFEKLEAAVQESIVQAESARQMEQVPVQNAAPKATQAAPADESIRVSLNRVDRLMNNVGELVILQAVLNQQKFQVASMLVQKTIDQLAKITKDIQDISLSLRMVPLKQTFQKMQRIVRDTSKALNKDVRFEIVGDDTELDKTVLEQIGDPLVHLIRNAVDHGLETTEERLKAGKSPQGVVRLSATHQGDHITIEVREDGRGLDAQKLISIAQKKGILKPGQTLTDEQAYQLVFASGFSTKTEVTDISGRGVGMDVVKSNVQALQGDIVIETEQGHGTAFKILLPLTLSIIDGMVLKNGEERFVVPINHVHESVQLTGEEIKFVTGLGEVIVIRGENIPMYRLANMLGRKQTNPKPIEECIAIIVRAGKHPFSVLVDAILGQQQVVIKRLGNEVKIKGISGGAILGDGRAALILDMPELATRAVPLKAAVSPLSLQKTAHSPAPTHIKEAA